MKKLFGFQFSAAVVQSFTFIIVAIIISMLFNTFAFAQESPVPAGAQVQHLSGGVSFAEGPLWHPNGFLLISDIDGNRIYKIDPQSGAKEVYLNPSGGSNGLSFDTKGNLIMCQRNARSLSRLEPNGAVTVLASRYDGKKFNSPNDLAVRSDGTIFFTDPYFSGTSPLPRELSFAGIYCLKPERDLMLLDNSIGTPNGICLSPDEKKLYVNDSFNLAIYAFDIGDDLKLTNKRIFAQMSGSGYGDGMKVDENGLLFSTGPGGVWIFSPDGKLIDKISVPGNASNLNWGEADYQTLYITNWNNVFKIRLNTKGVVTDVEQKEASLPIRHELLQNYPNPFNPSTVISFQLPANSEVSLSIYNMNGQLVRKLVADEMNAGRHNITWDATNERGQRVASGVYLYIIRAGGFAAQRKLVLMK